MKRLGLPLAPVKTQSFGGNFLSWTSGGNSTGSIICPSIPSPRRITGIRYLSARSKASKVKSASSWPEFGPRTIFR